MCGGGGGGVGGGGFPDVQLGAWLPAPLEAVLVGKLGAVHSCLRNLNSGVGPLAAGPAAGCPDRLADPVSVPGPPLFACSVGCSRTGTNSGLERWCAPVGKGWARILDCGFRAWATGGECSDVCCVAGGCSPAGGGGGGRGNAKRGGGAKLAKKAWCWCWSYGTGAGGRGGGGGGGGGTGGRCGARCEDEGEGCCATPCSSSTMTPCSLCFPHECPTLVDGACDANFCNCDEVGASPCDDKDLWTSVAAPSFTFFGMSCPIGPECLP